MIDDLKELGVAQGRLDRARADRLADLRRRPGGPSGRRAALPSDAVVWEEVEARTSESIELSGNFLAFMVLACLIASVGIFTGSPILIVGAMVVGPEFGPLAGLCVAAVERRLGVALRSLTALAIGFPVGITAAFLFTLICVATGLVDSELQEHRQPADPVHRRAGNVLLHRRRLRRRGRGPLPTSAKSGALIGVLISVTTIPAAANIGVAAALGNWADWRGRDGAAQPSTWSRSSSPASTTLYVERGSSSGGGGAIWATSRGPRPGSRETRGRSDRPA